ncbi:MAG: SDR family NAD(P)-dependent oxidoreductase [Myxococcota bacterium]
MRLEGKVALITGAGSGIGAATARQMASEGASVALVGIPGDSVAEVARQIQSEGGRAVGVPTDVSSPPQVQAAVGDTVEEFGRLDILVPNAGIQRHDVDRDLHEMSDEAWDETQGVNLRGAYLTCKNGLAQMVKQGDGGVITIVDSITALNGRCPNPSYMTAKGGLLSLNQHIAAHYGKHGIRCNAICPGALERTPNWDIHPDPDGRRERLEKQIPLGRLATPEDIAPWIVFLSTAEAGYATGATFVVDGGVTIV